MTSMEGGVPLAQPSGRPQNLHDLQNYLVTFNKEIEVSGERGFSQAIHPIRQGGPPSEVVFETQTGSQVSAVTEVDLLEKLKSDKQSDDENILTEAMTEELTLSEVKPVNHVGKDVVSLDSEVADDEQLSVVQAHIARLSAEQLQAVNISGQISLEGLQGLHASGGEGVMMIPLSGEAMASEAGQHLFQLVSVDGQSGLQVTNGTSVKQQDSTAGQQSVPAEADNSVDQTSVVSVTETSAIDGADPVAVLASVAANTSNISQLSLAQQDLNTAQLVALQNSSDSSQPQLVAVHNMDGSITEGNLHVVSADDGTINNSLVLNTGAGYQSLTLMPSGEVNQQGDVNYVLIVNQQNGDKAGYDFEDDIKGEVVEEIMDEDGTTKRVVKINQLLAKSSLEKIGAIPYGDQLMCTYCNYTSPKRYLLSRHLKSHSEERPHKCTICERGFKTMASLQNHVNTHTGTRPHKCKLCDAAFTTSGELVRHVRYKHTFEKPHKCTECDYASVELSKLKRHMRSHTGERPYQCMHCSYASPDTYKLKRHLRIHTGEKPYECNICHARFTQSNSLKAHKLIHTGNKPVFQCDLCPATCGRKTDLKIHMQKLHTSDKPLMCKKCGSTFPDRYTFKMHTKSHEGEKCFKCSECDYAALSARHLETHALTHTGEKPFECGDCDQSFRQKQLLKRHKNLYHTPDYAAPNPKDKEHECSECEKTYAHKGNLMRHMMQHDGTAIDSDGDHDGQHVCVHQKHLSGVVPLTADQLIQNSLLADMKEGKLGTSPKVVVVHPDGRVEEVTAKLQSMSQSKPVDDFLVSLGVTGDSSFVQESGETCPVSETGDESADGNTLVMTINEENMDVSTGPQQEALPIPTVLLPAHREEQDPSSEEEQKREAGTQATFDTDSDDEQKKSVVQDIVKLSAPGQARGILINMGDLSVDIGDNSSRPPTDLEDVQEIMISVLQAEEARGVKRGAEEIESSLISKRLKSEEEDCI